VGASSRDLRLTIALDIAAPPLPVRLDAMATLQEWLADPNGCVALREAIGVEPDGTPRGILGDQEMLTVIGNFPLSTLAAFPGVGIDRSTVDGLIQRFQDRQASQ
jgi:beta-glucosidase